MSRTIDLQRVVALTYQFPNHGDLLEILFTEIGLVAADDVEQAAHHLGYAVEMPRPVRAFHHLVQQPEIESSRIFFRINVFYRRGQREVGACFFEQCQIGFHGSRGVFRVVELGRIDENADDARVAFPPALFDQRQVPVVQRSHRRDETARARVPFQFVGKRCVPCENFHRNRFFRRYYRLYFNGTKVENCL